MPERVRGAHNADSLARIIRNTTDMIATTRNPLIQAEVWSGGAALILASEDADFRDVRMASAFLVNAGNAYGNARIGNLSRDCWFVAGELEKPVTLKEAREMVDHLRKTLVEMDIPTNAAAALRDEVRSIREYVENGHILRDRDGDRA